MRKKASKLCTLVLGTSLFLAGCGEKPNIPSYAYFIGSQEHGAGVYDKENGYVLGYWDAVKNEMTKIRNFQDLPEDYTTKLDNDKNGIWREFVYDNEGNHIGYIEPVDPLVKERRQARNPVEADYYDRQILYADRHVSSIQTFVPDTTRVVPRK